MIAHAISASKFANNLFEHIVDPLILLLGIIAAVLLIYMSILFIYKKDAYTDNKDLMKRLAIVVFGIFVIFSVWSLYKIVSRLAEGDAPTIQVEPAQPTFEALN